MNGNTQAKDTSNLATGSGTGFYRVEKLAGKWTFIDPTGKPFVSIGLNHAEETNLKYPHNIDIWKQRYGSRDGWINRGFLADLDRWGFNTIGWTQEFVSGDINATQDWFGPPFDIGHSAGWTAAELKAANRPYVVPMRVNEIEDWNGQPAFRDVFSKDFDVWCEYLARSIVHEHVGNPNLLGYFFVDIPAWVPHATGRFFPGFEGLSGPAYEKKLFATATRYYETIVGHIKKIDPDHLILGDRYNGNKLLPDAVLEAMKPFVDVLSIQYFAGPTDADKHKMVDDMEGWQRIAEKPIINADIGTWIATELNPNRRSALQSQADRGADYRRSMSALLEKDWFIGWHWCSYIENTARGWGSKDPWDEPYVEFIEQVSDLNHSTLTNWSQRFK